MSTREQYEIAQRIAKAQEPMRETARRIAEARYHTYEDILRGMTCGHWRMNWCCRKPCGYLRCPDCGLAWDVGAQQ
jgi:hypothetical protein